MPSKLENEASNFLDVHARHMGHSQGLPVCFLRELFLLATSPGSLFHFSLKSENVNVCMI